MSRIVRRWRGTGFLQIGRFTFTFSPLPSRAPALAGSACGRLMLEARAAIKCAGAHREVPGPAQFLSHPSNVLELRLRQSLGGPWQVLGSKGPVVREVVVPIPSRSCPEPYRTARFISLPETIKQIQLARSQMLLATCVFLSAISLLGIFVFGFLFGRCARRLPILPHQDDAATRRHAAIAPCGGVRCSRQAGRWQTESPGRYNEW